MQEHPEVSVAKSALSQFTDAKKVDTDLLNAIIGRDHMQIRVQLDLAREKGMDELDYPNISSGELMYANIIQLLDQFEQGLAEVREDILSNVLHEANRIDYRKPIVDQSRCNKINFSGYTVS